MGERAGQVQFRKSIRIPGYDYALPGGYFVTICAEGRKGLFGSIRQGSVQLNSLGEIAKKCWLWLEKQYPYVQLDSFCVMPDHFHGILFILDSDRRGGSRAAPTTDPVKIKPLGQLIGAFKTTSSKQINSIDNTPGRKIWQRNYYEHVIRDEDELNLVRQYILANPSLAPAEPFLFPLIQLDRITNP